MQPLSRTSGSRKNSALLKGHDIGRGIAQERIMTRSRSKQIRRMEGASKLKSGDISRGIDQERIVTRSRRKQIRRMEGASKLKSGDISRDIDQEKIVTRSRRKQIREIEGASSKYTPKRLPDKRTEDMISTMRWIAQEKTGVSIKEQCVVEDAIYKDSQSIVQDTVGQSKKTAIIIEDDVIDIEGEEEVVLLSPRVENPYEPHRTSRVYQIMEQEGFVHLPVKANGLCCYQSIAHVLNIRTLCNYGHSTRHHQILDCVQEAESVIQTTLCCLQALSRIQSRKNKDGQTLLECMAQFVSCNPSKEECIDQPIEHLSRVLDSIRQGKMHYGPREWGSTQFIGIASFIFGVPMQEIRLSSVNNAVVTPFKFIPKSEKEIYQLFDVIGFPIGSRFFETEESCRHSIGTSILYHGSHFDNWIHKDDIAAIKQGLEKLKKEGNELYSDYKDFFDGIQIEL